MQDESWLPVVGLEDLYLVSDHGRVKALPRKTRVCGGGTAVLPERIMRPYGTKKMGHWAIDLTPDDGRKRIRTRVHILVLEAFVGPRPDGYAACHNDGNVDNNHVSNLRWDTYSANNYDMVQHGTHHYAKRDKCRFGHEFDGAWLYPDGSFRQRYCKTCHKKRTSDYKAQKRGFASRAEAEIRKDVQKREREEFGRQLSAVMQQCGLNQVQAAELLGTSQANVWRWLNGRCAPAGARRESILQKLGASA